MKHSGEINIQIPLLMTKDGEDFLISCRQLSIYIKDGSEESAMSKFSEAVELLFDKLVEKQALMPFLKSRDILYKDIPFNTPVGNVSLDNKKTLVSLPKLELGNHAKFNVPVPVCYA